MKYGTDQCECGGEVVESRGEEAALSSGEEHSRWWGGLGGSVEVCEVWFLALTLFSATTTWAIGD